jgi:hypothetical protein
MTRSFIATMGAAAMLAIGGGRALALVDNHYPGRSCFGASSSIVTTSNNIGVTNTALTSVNVHCPVVKNAQSGVGLAQAWVVDGHPTANVYCSLCVFNAAGLVGGACSNRYSTGFTTSPQTLEFTAFSRAPAGWVYTLSCLLPSKYGGSQSSIRGYRVLE